jgi:N-acetylneuraminic acid mutarotase
MQRSSHGVWAFLIAYPLLACGGASKSNGVVVPVDAGPGTSMSGSDASTATDAAVVLEASSPEDAAVITGPGVLLFAGYGPGPLQDTWNWNGSAWTQLSLAGPSVRSDQSMIGVATSQVLLFGGEGLGPYLGDTWIWSGNQTTWTQLSVTGPSAREGAATALLDGKVILYGGSEPSNGFLSDTWQWDGTQWTQLAITGPTPGGRYGHSMATLGSKIVLFGNVGGPTDTWTFDGTSWTQAATIGPTGNAAGLSDSRGFQTMATLGGKVVLFGGEQDANDILDDTWTWDGAAWTEATVANPPPARFHAGMTTFQDKVLLFGGAGAIPNGAPFLADTWTWDGTTWTQVATDGPSGRYAYALAVH